jgi:putative membrane protein
MRLHRPLLAAALLVAGAAFAQSSSQPTTNPTPQSSGSSSQPPGLSGTTPPSAPGQAMTPPVSSALGTTPAPAGILAELHMANQSEVELGKIAEQRAHDKAVKSFGKRMVKDHTALDKDAQSWAKKNKVTVGPPPQGEDMQKMQDVKQHLQILSGPEFDKAYMQAMAEDHAGDLKKVQTFQQETTDKSLQKLLKNAEKVIASHKKDADKLVQKLGASASR